jgi:hypothetical protein
MILDKGRTYVYYMGSTLGWPNELGRSVRQASPPRFRTKPTARGNPTLSPRVHHQDRGSHISWHQCVGTAATAHESTPDRVFDITFWLFIGFSNREWASSVVNSSHSLSIRNLPPNSTQCLSVWSTRWWVTSLCLTLPTSPSLRSWLGSLATTTLMAGALQAIIRLGSATWRTHQSGRNPQDYQEYLQQQEDLLRA